MQRQELGIAQELESETRDADILQWAKRAQRSVAEGQRAAAIERKSM